MKFKNKTILMFILVFAAITLCYSPVMAYDEWTNRVLDDGEEDFCFTTAPDDEGWLICRYETNGTNGTSFPEVIGGDTLRFNYAVVPTISCNDNPGLCPTWSFFVLYGQENVFDENYFVGTLPKGATLQKDPITQCGETGTGMKWNPKINLQGYKKDPTAPKIFSISFKMGAVETSAACVRQVVVSSSECSSGSIPGPILNTGFLQNERTYTCSYQGDNENWTVALTVTYNECSSVPEDFVAQRILPSQGDLDVREINEPYFYMKEKDVSENPEIRAFPVSDVGPYSGAFMCSEKIEGITPPGKNLPFFVWGNQVWNVEEQAAP